MKTASKQNLENLNTFKIQILASHISLSLNYALSISKNTSYKLYLYKGQKNCSEINQFKNRLIFGKLFTGKILFNQLTFQFSIKTDKTNEELIREQQIDQNVGDSYSLKLFSVKNFSNSQKLIASYQLQMDRYIRQFLKLEKKYFHQQGQMDEQIYITYQVFVERSITGLHDVITQQKYKQKQKIKERILKNIQLQRKNTISAETHKQIEEQLKVLKHLSSEGKRLSTNEKNNFQNNKIQAIQQLSRLNSSSSKIDLLLNLPEQDKEFDLKNSQIKIMEEMNSPNYKSTFMLSKKGKRIKQLFKFDQSPLQIHIKQTQSDSISLKNDSNLIGQSSLHKDSMLGSFGSQFSVNNEYLNYVWNQMPQEMKKNLQDKAIKQNIGNQKMLVRTDQQRSQQIMNTRIPFKQTRLDKHSNSMIQSQISLRQQSIIYQTRKTKFMIMMFFIIVISMIFLLIDDPFFDVLSVELPKKLSKGNSKKKYKSKIRK